MAKKQIKYYTWAHNIDMCLRNGSFVRGTEGKEKEGYAQFMNGDYMGRIPAVPMGMAEVDAKKAKSLLPSCCK